MNGGEGGICNQSRIEKAAFSLFSMLSLLNNRTIPHGLAHELAHGVC